MEELSEYYPPNQAVSTCYELNLDSSSYVEPNDAQDFVEFERTEGARHKRYFAIIGPQEFELGEIDDNQKYCLKNVQVQIATIEGTEQQPSKEFTRKVAP